MLVSRFQIHVGWIAQLGTYRAHRFMRDAAVDPDVDRVAAVGRAFGQTELLRKIDIIELPLTEQ